ncbi:MAG: 23S rRNA (uracil(1939)-C(5))-methyltransferase RlmD [Acidobacteriota bacterium]
MVPEVKSQGRRQLSPSGSCSPAGTCTGCPLIHLDYQAQLEWKEEQVRSCLGAGPARPLILPIRPADPPLGYRATAKLSVAIVRNKVRVGLFRPGTREVLDTTDCPAHHFLVNSVAAAVKAELDHLVASRHPLARAVPMLRHVVIRVSPVFGKAMVTLVVGEDDQRFANTMSKGLQRRVPEVVSVHLNLNSKETSQVFGPTTRLIWGYPDLLDQIGPNRILLSPVSFFQAHHGQAAWIYALVREWAELQPAERALDVYCGAGGIAMSLARNAKLVIGIEASAEAVRDAKRNARLNSLTNCRFRSADAGRLAQVVRHGEQPAVVSLNPPRTGAAAPVLSQIAGLGPRRILYVSCNPETLARDLDILSRLGYKASRVQPVDMFPQTPHVETIVQLEGR